MRILTSIAGNSQRLDGGAMFGNAPKALWTRWTDVDDQNRIPLACRALLVEEYDAIGRFQRRILFETGIGAFFEPKLKDRYGVVESEHVLLRSLAALGLQHTDIDVVVLSHLHFDHAGGLLSAYEEGKSPELLFDNATFVVGEAAWERALAPHARDRASFLPQLHTLLKDSGRLEIVREQFDRTYRNSDTLGPDYRIHRSDGHTPGLLLTEIPTEAGPVVFAGDLVPATPWVHLPITMGYDRFPEQLIDEKLALYEDLIPRKGRLFYTHDPEVAMSAVKWDGKRFRAHEPLATLERWGSE